MSQNTAKQVVLQLGSLITLFVSLGFFIGLLFSIITLQFPDAADGSWEIQSAKESLRLCFAMVLVFFPAYLGLTRTVNKIRRTEQQTTYTGFTKWLIYLALLLAGLILLSDLVAVILSYLEGDITLRFILKALSVLVVVGSAFIYYLLDAQGYWLQREKLSIWYGVIVTLLIIVGLGYALTFIDSPREVREQRIDQSQLSDLQTMQWQLQNFITVENRVPESLSEVTDVTIPTAPEGRTDYRYEKTETGFMLCATFNTNSQPPDTSFVTPIDKTAVILNPDQWEYVAGETCFERTVQLATVPSPTE